MDLLLTDEQTLLRDSAARLLARAAGPKKLRALRDSNTGFDPALWREIAEAGWLAILVPEFDGGLGLGATELCLVAEQAGAALLTLPVGIAAAAAPALAGSPHLADAIAGRTLVLPVLDRVVPFANVADAFLADGKIVGRDGVSVTPARLVDGSAVGTISLANGETPAGVRDAALLALAAELVGVAGRALAIALDYLKVRVQFDKPIGSFQALQHRAAEEFMEVELAHSLVFQVAARFDRGDASPAMAAAAKARAAQAALRVCKSALQFHGAMGYTDEHDIGLYFKRAMALAAAFGNDSVQRRRFARLAGIEAG
jgi:alkylation response protein AidB-like acyl-CoA dehydrogenase